MRIAYVGKLNLAQGAGVVRKIDGQTAVWRAEGNDTRVFVLTSASQGNIAPAGPADVLFAAHGAARFAACRELLSRISRWQPDVVYLRYCTYQPGFGRLFALAPVVVEVNSDDTTEIHFASRTSHVYNLASRGRVLKRASGIACVTNELAHSASFAAFSAPRVVIGNGISLAGIPQRATTPGNSRPRLFFMGSGDWEWHGIDKILLLARLRPRWRFDIVGGARMRGLNLPPNVVGHGQLAHADYAELLHTADVAVSTLAIHRKGLEEASPLKTREYLAAGVPAIIAYSDTDFLRGAPFLLQLPNAEENIVPQIQRIDHFVQTMRGVVVPRSSIAHLDWSAKEPRRLAFMRGLVEASRNRVTRC